MLATCVHVHQHGLAHGVQHVRSAEEDHIHLII